MKPLYRRVNSKTRDLVLSMTAAHRQIMHVGEDKEGSSEIIKIPVGKTWKEDFWIDEDAYDEMIVAKTRLLKDFPFWGILSMGLRLVEDKSGFINTLATDGRHMFYNAEFVMRLNRGERVFGVGHEILHCLFSHSGESNRGMYHADFTIKEKDAEKRKENEFKAKVCNFAADYIVNDELVLGQVGALITTINILHDTKFRGWSFEEVYDYLMENPDEMPGDGQQFDQHIEIEITDEDGDGKSDGGDSKDGKNGGGTKVKMSRAEYEAMKKEWKDNTMRAAAAQKEAEARGECAGSLPAGVQRFLDELTKPVVNWKTMLRRYVMQTMMYDYSFARPNKALFNEGFTIPGFRSPQDMLDIVIAVDTSGSISQDQLTAFVSEMDGIMKSFPAYNIQAWCFEGNVVQDSICTIKRHEGTFEDISKFAERIGGGGGTDFECNWTYMKEKRIKPKLFLFLTDGYPFGSWGDPRYCPTIFLIIGNPGTNAPFGLSIHYEDQ